MKYLVLFICSMIIPAMNTSAVSIALSNNIVDLIFYIIDFGVFGWGIQRLKEKDEHPERNKTSSGILQETLIFLFFAIFFGCIIYFMPGR